MGGDTVRSTSGNDALTITLPCYRQFMVNQMASSFGFNSYAD